MDGETITAITVTATVNIVTIISMIYYLKGKVETLERSLNKRIDDLDKSVNRRIDDLKYLISNRIRNIENTVYKRD